MNELNIPLYEKWYSVIEKFNTSAYIHKNIYKVKHA